MVCFRSGKERVAALLRILVKGEKHLPPLNWGFLYGLMESSNGKICDHTAVIAETVLAILARQSPHSTSAKKLIELALEDREMSPSDTWMDGLLRNLPSLCEAFGQSDEDVTTLNSFAVDVFVYPWVDLVSPVSPQLDSGSTDLFCSRLQILKNLLSSRDCGLERLEELMADQLHLLLRKCQDPVETHTFRPLTKPYRDQLYTLLLEVTAHLPSKYLEKINNHESDEVFMTVSLDLRCEVAKTMARSNPKETGRSSLLVWLNNCADAVASDAAGCAGKTLELLYRHVFVLATRERAARAGANKQWLLELMGQSRAVSRAKASSKAGEEAGFRVLFQVVHEISFHLAFVTTFCKM